MLNLRREKKKDSTENLMKNEKLKMALGTIASIGLATSAACMLTTGWVTFAAVPSVLAVYTASKTLSAHDNIKNLSDNQSVAGGIKEI